MNPALPTQIVIPIQEYLLPVLVPLGIILGSWVLGLFIRNILHSRLLKLAKQTPWEVGGVFIQTTRQPFILWCVIGGAFLALEFTQLSEKWIHLAHKGLGALLLISVTLVLAQVAVRSLASYASRPGATFHFTSLSKYVIQFAIWAVGLMILLESFGIRITGLIAAVGVSGLAVAMGLQSTLANLFAGISIMVGKQIRLGDYIKLDSGEEGYVVDISSRAITLRTLPNNAVVIPHSKLSQAIYTNFSLPEKKMSLLVPFSVNYSSDPDHVERVVVDEAKRTEVPGLLKDPEPFVRFIPGFGASSLDFTLICHVREFVDQYLVQHELRKRILKRFRAEGIEIPYPTRTVYMRGEK